MSRTYEIADVKPVAFETFGISEDGERIVEFTVTRARFSDLATSIGTLPRKRADD